MIVQQYFSYNVESVFCGEKSTTRRNAMDFISSFNYNSSEETGLSRNTMKTFRLNAIDNHCDLSIALSPDRFIDIPQKSAQNLSPTCTLLNHENHLHSICHRKKIHMKTGDLSYPEHRVSWNSE